MDSNYDVLCRVALKPHVCSNDLCNGMEVVLYDVYGPLFEDSVVVPVQLILLVTALVLTQQVMFRECLQ